MPVILPPGVVTSPAATAQNVIIPTDDAVIALAVRAHSPTQSADLQNWQNSLGAPQCGINAAAMFYANNLAGGGFGQIVMGDLGGVFSSAGEIGFVASHANLDFILDTGRSIKLSADLITGASRTALTGFRGTSDIMQNSGSDDSPALFLGNGANFPSLVCTQGTALSSSVIAGASFLVRGDNRTEWWQATSTTRRALSVTQGVWATATDASRAGRQTFSVMDFGGTRECLRLEATGTAAAIGFLGGGAVVQQANASQAAITAVTDANAKSALQAIYNLLHAYNLAPATA